MSKYVNGSREGDSLKIMVLRISSTRIKYFLKQYTQNKRAARRIAGTDGKVEHFYHKVHLKVNHTYNFNAFVMSQKDFIKINRKYAKRF